jgi:hypothetical protein
MNLPPLPVEPRIETGVKPGYVRTISAVAAMGGLLLGYDRIVISGTDLLYEAYFHLTSLWIAGFVLTEAFSLLRGHLGPAETFWIYGGICLFGWLLLRSKLPETKRKTREQVEPELVN